MIKHCTFGCLAFTLAALSACSETDPYLRPGMWQPAGANTLNLAAMIVKPTDLIRGRGTTGTPGIEGTPPVTRYWAGRQIQLPTTTTSASGAGQGRSDTGGTSAGTGSAGGAN